MNDVSRYTEELKLEGTFLKLGSPEAPLDQATAVGECPLRAALRGEELGE